MLSICTSCHLHALSPARAPQWVLVLSECIPMLLPLSCWPLAVSALFWLGGAHPVGFPEREKRGHGRPLPHLCGQPERRCGRPGAAGSLPAHRRVLRRAHHVGPQHWPLQGLWLCFLQVCMSLLHGAPFPPLSVRWLSVVAFGIVALYTLGFCVCCLAPLFSSGVLGPLPVLGGQGRCQRGALPAHACCVVAKKKLCRVGACRTKEAAERALD
jgi:hypothetical protein